MIESCPTMQAIEKSDEEIQFYPLSLYRSRSNFDPYHCIKTINGRKYKHRLELEDYWVNATNEFEIRKRMWSRLSMSLIRVRELFPMPDQLKMMQIMFKFIMKKKIISPFLQLIGPILKYHTYLC